MADVGIAVQAGDEVGPRLGNAEFEGHEIVGDEFRDAGDEFFQTSAGFYGNEYGLGKLVAQRGQGVGSADTVDFIENDQRPPRVGAEFCEDRAGRFVKFHHLRLAGVEHMDEEIAEHRLFECGIEGLDQAVRELADKTHGVGEQERLVVREFDLARGGVEGCEEFVFDENLGAGEGAKEGGFAGVRVTNDGGVRHRSAFSVIALGGALEFHGGEVALEAVDLTPDFAFVLLELGFALALGADAAALLAEVRPGPDEPGEGILHAGEIDLQASLAGVSAFGENVENHLLAVDHEDGGEFFPIPLLGGGEFVVENDDIRAEGLCAVGDFLRLARAHQEPRVVLAVVDEFAADDRDAECVDEFGKFLEQTVRFRSLFVARVGPNKQGALDHLWLFLDFKHPEARKIASAAEPPQDRRFFNKCLCKKSTSRLSVEIGVFF